MRLLARLLQKGRPLTELPPTPTENRPSLASVATPAIYTSETSKKIYPNRFNEGPSNLASAPDKDAVDDTLGFNIDLSFRAKLKKEEIDLAIVKVC